MKVFFNRIMSETYFIASLFIIHLKIYEFFRNYLSEQVVKF